MNQMKFTSEVAQIRIGKIQQLLRAQDMSIAELGAEIHLTLRWMRAYVGHLHSGGYVHISAWRRQVRNSYQCFTPLYCWGNATDAKRPQSMTQAERLRAKRAALAADAIEHAAALARRRLKNIKPKRDWAARWIPTRAAV